MKRFYLLPVLLILFISVQAQKKVLSHEDYKVWKNITHKKISDNGKWVAYDAKPMEDGDPVLTIKNTNGTLVLEAMRGSDPSFTYDSEFTIFKILPAVDSVKELKRAKTKKEDLPKDTLAIYTFSNKGLTKIPHLKSYKLPKKWSSYIAYQYETAPKKKSPSDTTKVKDDNANEKKKKAKSKKENKDNGYPLVIRNLVTAKQDTFKYVTDYVFAEESQAFAFVTTGEDSTVLPGIYTYDFNNGTAAPVFRSKGKYKKLAWDKKGSQLAFVADLDTTKVQIRPFGLYYWKIGSDSARMIANKGNSSLPQDWIISEHYNVNFSKDGSKLFFGTAPEPIVQDTTLLPEEIINVEVWSYTDSKLHTQQKVEKESDSKKSYVAVMTLNNSNIQQLGNKTIENISLGDEGNAGIALGSNPQPYNRSISWEGFPGYNDLYVVDISTGNSEKIATKIRGRASLSPKAKYVYWYDVADSAWFAYSIAKKKTLQITDNTTVPFYNEQNNSPNHPYPYGVMAWTEDDAKVLIYDRYDIWEIDPGNKTTQINLTKDGRSQKRTYRYVKLDKEERFISKNHKLIVSAFNNGDKSEGIYNLTYGKNTLKKLIEGPFNYGRLVKAQQANAILYTKETFTTFPDVIATDLSFKSSVKISNLNPQQKDYNWGNAELYNWTALDGTPLEGILIKPDNFDPSKKYPMMVYFYERMADRLHNYSIPAAGRASVNFSFYSGRDYIVFIPNIEYRIGYPGESAYNCVIPGVTSLIDKGFVEKDNIGVQGHSWGGYQIAYLVTKTDIFKCAESGAPVSNMTSAYGGIRWGTGLSRMFQYEHTQSRIGGTLWEYPLRYIENSPIFFTDKINTPLLILHNDKDTAVPWYQGIEFFVALRRLGKPAWMVNYQGEPHGITKPQNKKDFAIRMQQFFDYYLKDAPKPKWMRDGVPALEVGIRQGYDPVSTDGN